MREMIEILCFLSVAVYILTVGLIWEVKILLISRSLLVKSPDNLSQIPIPGI